MNLTNEGAEPSRRSEAAAAVLAAIDKNWTRQLAFLQELVREDSIAGNEAGAQSLVKKQFDQLDVATDSWAITDGMLERWKGIAGTGTAPYADRPNLAATMNGAGGGRSLILNGHIDVVPPGPESVWHSSPWEPRIEGGRMFGRGTADMKAGVTSLVFVGHALRDANVTLCGDLTLMTVIDEECTGNGTLSAIDRGYRADAAIMPEPSGCRARDAEVAVLWVRITTRGRGGHAKNAGASVNAIDKAAFLVAGVHELQERANAAPGRPAVFEGIEHPLNYNVGVISGGDWASSVPPLCSFEVRISAFPGEKIEDIRRKFEEGLLEIAARDPWLKESPPEVEWIGFAAVGSQMERDAELFAMLGEVHGEITGEILGFDTALGTSDQRLFIHQADMPATVYGPLGGDQHGPAEWVDIESIKQATKVLALFALDWCGISTDEATKTATPQTESKSS
ncbi:MAG: ArgE/DapE family deacylase [Homoserinimonas sp.]